MKRRTQDELLEKTFRAMWKMGDLELVTVEVPLRTGGTFEKTFYRVKPNKHRTT